MDRYITGTLIKELREKKGLTQTELANELAEASRGIYNAQGIEWRTSLFTYYQFMTFGSRSGATPDGRREPSRR